MALEGDMAAIKEVIDRTEGKAVQPIDGALGAISVTINKLITNGVADPIDVTPDKLRDHPHIAQLIDNDSK